ncbi:MAG: insulinase family protein, partial [Chloroflexota bacterium]
GDSTDLETMTRDDLYAHYQRYYTPSNAVIVAVGAFDSADMLADIKSQFGHLENTPQPTAFVRPEPSQQGERRVTVERPGMTSFLSMAHRVPACTERDWFAMEVLNSVLTGSGGSIDNKTARLYKTLVKSGIAASIDGDLSESIDPYLYEITVTLSDGYTHAEAEAVILAEIDHMQTHGITEAELNKAKKQAKASFAYSSESVTNQAYWLAHSHIIDDPNWYDDFLERLGAVTIEDVQRVAQTYLNARNRVTGWLVPIMLDEDEDDYDDMYDEADEAEAEVAQ